ncbi:hypothetical protein ACT17_15090 [Mycolicibacterium conceptionense]|uniref:Uncharacterized protein n=2 Tax=Mycolicibacterium conceptionense TaxID=451644 RepID=A0A0J8U9C3_9MYCO|nr:hypothetical protein ACT17_15090 [Mycolicibacterium conceptionense]
MRRSLSLRLEGVVNARSMTVHGAESERVHPTAARALPHWFEHRRAAPGHANDELAWSPAQSLQREGEVRVAGYIYKGKSYSPGEVIEELIREGGGVAGRA